MAITVFPRLDAPTNRFARLRKGHWSTQGLVYAATFGQGAPGGMFPETFLTTEDFSVTAQGLNFSTTSEFLTVLPATHTTRLPTQRVTILAVRQKADTTGRTSALFGLNESTAGNRCGAHLPFNDGNIYFDFGGTSSPNRISAAFTATTEVEAWACIAGYNGSSIWRNGIVLVSQSTAITRSDSTESFLVNRGNGSGAGGDVQDLWFFAVLDAEWIPTQVVEWSANPWLMFQTNTSQALTVAGGGAGSIPRMLYHYRQQGMA